MLKIGDKAPEVLGLDQNGKEVKISDFGGKKIILYFYINLWSWFIKYSLSGVSEFADG